MQYSYAYIYKAVTNKMARSYAIYSYAYKYKAVTNNMARSYTI